MSGRFATIILAGGKGTRMGSSEKHKVCFDVLGVPVIIRALETYNLCGASLNLIVVGMMAESVMGTVNRRFPGTAYAFQEQALGTGNAARKGAEILERMGFAGDILVVAGDKVIDPKALRHLLAAHQRARADVTLATARRPPHSNSGILLKSARGNIVGILEEAERQRLIALGRIHDALAAEEALPRSVVERVAAETCGDRAARALLKEVWAGAEAEGVDGEAVLTRARFAARFGLDERRGLLRLGREVFDAAKILERFDQVNLSTYLFKAPVLYDALGRLKPSRANQEEYLTDVFEILASRGKPARVVGCEITDPRDLMAFNNPQELLAIEEVYRQRQGIGAVEAPVAHRDPLAPVAAWEHLFASPSASVRREFRQWYGEEIPWDQFRRAVEAFAARFGSGRPVAIVRSPGRINLMGRHIDHQGGSVNVMAINREIVMVAAARADDQVTLTNMGGPGFADTSFRISDMVASLNWDDWQRVIDGPRLQRLLESARGDWANYIKAAILRLQEQFRDRQLHGLDIMVSGDIPMGAGLSSSSALVVATAEIVRTVNHLPVSARRLVSLCGEGEWFVGTRGGAADHAAIRLSRRGCVTRVGFFPFRIEDSAPFLGDHDLVCCNSGIYAGKSREVRNAFNAKVTAYHIGRVWCKMLRPDLAPGIEHLRDVAAETLLSRMQKGRAVSAARHAYAGLLASLPARISRQQVQSALAQMPEAERDRIDRLFQTHDAPPDGYSVRGVTVFGLAEMDRARRCLELLRRGDAKGLGRLMDLSHDGDRVSRETSRHTWRRATAGSIDQQLGGWAESRAANLAGIPGEYGCSLPELDRIADIARRLPGVEGAQLAGAGLGGCVMVLVQKEHSAEAVSALTREGIGAQVFRPIAGACTIPWARPDGAALRDRSTSAA